MSDLKNVEIFDFDAACKEAVESKLNINTKYDHLPTKSAKIRKMYEDGMKKTEIATRLNIRYQHVRNVLLQPLSTK